MRRATCLLLVVGTLTFLAACEDRAAPSLEVCMKAESSGDMAHALEMCRQAATLDPNSTAGKAAAAKIVDLERKTKEAQAAAEAATKIEQAAAIEQAKADEEARRALKRKIRVAGDNEPDGECQAQGKPAFRNQYSGGTYAENEQVALGNGCVHLFAAHMDHSPNDNIFCCPK